MRQHVTRTTLEKDAETLSRGELVRSMRLFFGMSERVAVMILAEIDAWSGTGYKRNLLIPAAEIREAVAEDVRRDFRGNNHQQVMHSCQISKATLYRIIKNERGL